MDDLLKQLRDQSWRDGRILSKAEMEVWDQTYCEAANELEQLQSLLAEQAAELKRLWAACLTIRKALENNAAPYTPEYALQLAGEATIKAGPLLDLLEATKAASAAEGKAVK